ncbi:Bifunctional adenosine 5'-phosphosulfate phosphorylase/adenylylsulfatase HINT4 [Porphyridium purpureum]|uniref:Bifunctional adenosine 5'-phosphosulfate phosphorylase/adenylylsulfatase HINT4 n=1 Tax=Porphyridium purpureum TaxID=35688 RepID=A0A5J4YGB4_PORPP|nr:Bifunctional adenosine 5'-phosphosulfate phosphorylase/adenylylsulfatase HINT4 [Porphyridium purpureum]|eukprot:POR5162..scf267_23
MPAGMRERGPRVDTAHSAQEQAHDTTRQQEQQQPHQRREEWEAFFRNKSNDDVVMRDEQLVVFWDRAPGAHVHLLVVPRHEFIRGVEKLRAVHEPLLRHMIEVGRDCVLAQHAKLAQADGSHGGVASATADVVLGFHAPVTRSVPYLHMHAMMPPFNSTWGKFKYRPLRALPFLGFIDAERVIKRLRK